jgi:DNA (cytosine-5)-methyltransferase 1
VDWPTVEPVDIVTAGFPCQDISYAGRGAGLAEGTRSGLWHTIAHAVRVLRPRYLFVENVTALRRRGLDTVAADLAASGYDLAWRCLRASDIGAPHRRDRLFLLATPAGDTDRLRRHGPRPCPTHRARLQPAHSDRPHHGTGDGPRARGTRRVDPSNRWCAVAAHSQACPPSHSSGRRRCQGQPTPEGFQGRPHTVLRRCRTQREQHTASSPLTSTHTDWGQYESAIRRWEHIVDRPAPRPTCPGRNGTLVLSPDFVEWMMGLPPGWTDGLGLSRTARLRLCGNAVVPQQASHALQLILQEFNRPEG